MLYTSKNMLVEMGKRLFAFHYLILLFPSTDVIYSLSFIELVNGNLPCTCGGHKTIDHTHILVPWVLVFEVVLLSYTITFQMSNTYAQSWSLQNGEVSECSQLLPMRLC